MTPVPALAGASDGRGLPKLPRRRWIGCGLLLLLAASAGCETESLRPKRTESIEPGYTVVLRPRSLIALDAVDDRFDLDILRQTPLASLKAYHVSLAISSGAAAMAGRSSTCEATPQGGASCRLASIVPLRETLRRGRLLSLVPAWRYGGFSLEVAVRENAADGPVVYRLRQDDVVLGVAWLGFLGWIWLPALLAGIALSAVAIAVDAARAGPARRRVVALDLSAVTLLAIAAAAFSRWAALLLAPLAVAWLIVPLRVKVAAADARRAALAGEPDRSWWSMRWLSPAVMAVSLTGWLLLWHHSLILVHGFVPNDFREYMRGIAALYLAGATAFSLLLHAALWRRPAGRPRTSVALPAFAVLLASGLARALDWGTFYYSAGHVDEDFWTNLFYRQNLGFASSRASWWPAIGLAASAVMFALLFRLAFRYARVAPDEGRRGEGARPSRAPLLCFNALAAFAVVAGAHAAWGVLIPPPAREISGSVREAFAGIPEFKALEPLARRVVTRPPVRPEIDLAFVSKLARAGIRLNSVDPDYPLMRPSIYLDQAGREAARPHVPAGTNLIVILSESLSSALLDDRVHGIRGLTPNFADFARCAYTFRNLYSADFPTIKGQIATLASFAFDHHGLSTTSESGNPLKSRFLFLSDVLKPRGYQTVHVQADFGSFASTKAIFTRHRYDRIWSAEDRELAAAVTRPMTKTWGIHDEDLFRVLNRMLDTGEVRSPFLATVATTDLHFPYTVVHRHPGTSGNDLLDAVYTEDRAFGEFWTRFKQSAWAANTMILLTADHALVRQAVRRGGTDPRVSEFDYVTGMLYVPGDASWAGRGTDTVCTQLDLAPTLLDVMGIDLPNPFLGLSIFSDRPRYPLALGRDVPLDRLSPADRLAVDAIGWTPDDQARYMALLRYLAVTDRITK